MSVRGRVRGAKSSQAGLVCYLEIEAQAGLLCFSIGEPWTRTERVTGLQIQLRFFVDFSPRRPSKALVAQCVAPSQAGMGAGDMLQAREARHPLLTACLGACRMHEVLC